MEKLKKIMMSYVFITRILNIDKIITHPQHIPNLFCRDRVSFVSRRVFSLAPVLARQLLIQLYVQATPQIVLGPRADAMTSVFIVVHFNYNDFLRKSSFMIDTSFTGICLQFLTVKNSSS